MIITGLFLCFLIGCHKIHAFGGKDELLGFISPMNIIQVFQQWMELNSVVYDNLLTTWTRFKVFKENVERVFELNNKYNGTAKFALTQFADLTAEEFSKIHLFPYFDKFINRTVISEGLNNSYFRRSEDASEVDWTKAGVVNPARNQGAVGTCYIIASLAMIETRWAMKGKQHVNLSVEQVADCLSAYDGPFSENIACGINGGLPHAVFQYIKTIGGLEAENDYPYCVGGGRCKPCAPPGYDSDICMPYPINKCKEEDSCNALLDQSKFVKGLKVKSWHRVAQNEKIIAQVLEAEGPLAVAIDATDLQFYMRGILQPDRCKPYRLNHAALVVGYGTEETAQYWKVLNSWGAKFGEDGYFRLARDVGACGVNRYVISVDLE